MNIHDPGPSRPGEARLRWLDGLRGIAALAVAIHHGTYVYTPQFRGALLEWFNPGTWGVMIFFLISGYIIPSSLERHGDVRRFWVSRIFRIYPLWCVAVTVLVLLAVTGVNELRGELRPINPVVVVVSHASMLQDMLAVPNAINVLWTLSYEMAFYLLVVGLFAWGAHRRTAPVICVLVAGGVLLTFLAGAAQLSSVAGVNTVATVSVVILVAAMGSGFSSNAVVGRLGATAGAAMALVLVVANGRISPWYGLSVLAMMFSGTLMYRARKKEVPVRVAAVFGSLVFIVTVAQGWMHPREVEGGSISWTVSMVLVAFFFLGGMALQDRKIPAPLVRLGEISFSVYLLHPMVLKVSDALVGRWRIDNFIPLFVYLLLLIPTASVAYRLVEYPAQMKGRRMIRSMR